MNKYKIIKYNIICIDIYIYTEYIISTSYRGPPSPGLNRVHLQALGQGDVSTDLRCLDWEVSGKSLFLG